jgi:hypothetical protein
MAKNLDIVQNGWFEVDKKGLAKLLKEGGKGRLIGELIQNAFDAAGAKTTHIKLQLTEDNLLLLEVKDDSPEGFKRLADSWTLFAESEKKADSKLRGRFNLGEKLVLSLCEEAKIMTTTGTVEFHRNNMRIFSKKRTTRGTIFTATMKGDKTDFAEITSYVHSVLVSSYGAHRLHFNDKQIPPHKELQNFVIPSLETVGINKNGDLIRTARNCNVSIHQVFPTEVPHLYEMGLPVMPLDDYGINFHINIGQKVPLSFNRDSVPSGFLKKIFTHTYNHTFFDLKPDDFNETWVNEATSSEQCKTDGFKKFIENKFGDKTAFFDPSDIDANKNFQADGGVIIYGRMLNKQQIENAKEAGVVGSGKLTPSQGCTGVRSQITIEDTFSDTAHIAKKYFEFISKRLTGEVFTFQFVDFNNPLVNYKWQDQTLLMSNSLVVQWELTRSAGTTQILFQTFDNTILPALVLRKVPNKICKEFNEELCKLASDMTWSAVQTPNDFLEFWTYAEELMEVNPK